MAKGTKMMWIFNY